MGRKRRNMKNIIAVTAVITVVMAILLIAFSSMASAESFDRNYTADGGAFWYEGTLKHTEKPNKAGKILNVYKGEEILFLNKTLNNKSVAVTVFGPCESDGDWEDDYDDYPVSAWGVFDTSGKSKGYYVVKEDVNPEVGGWFNLRKHSIEVELVGEKEKVQKGRKFSLRIKKGENDKLEGVMTLTIEDDEGYSIMNVEEPPEDIYEILLDYKDKEDFIGFAVNPYQKPVEGMDFKNGEKNGEIVFDTAKLKMKGGMKKDEWKYTVILEDYATEADDDVEIEVKKRYVEVECEEEEVVKGDDIVIIIDSSFFEEKINITVEDIYDEDKPLERKLDKDGKKKVMISTESVDYGTHKITVEVCGTKEKETRYVTIMKGVASIEKVPEEASVGDIVFIKGKTDFGDFAVFLVDDEFKGETRIREKKGEKVFEWDWDTDGELDGYHGIEVFIVSEHANFSIDEQVSEDWQRKKGVDASAGIFLLLPEFCMTVSKNIAEGDEVVISGEATGTDHVYVIVFNYKGEVMFPAGGIAKTTAVEDEEWEENIGELDSGRYTVIALYEGKDGVTDAIKDDGTWAAGDEGKTLEQRVAILEDAMSSAGGDDQFGKRDFSVSTPKISLKVPGTVEIGDAITVKAETNIREGEKAFISLLFNSSIIKKNSSEVKNGRVTASIDTSGLRLLPGKYNVAVDISGRASDEKEVILVEKKEEEQEGEEGKESMPQNESVTEPEAVAGASESVGESSGEINESQEGEERKIPVSGWDLLIAVIVAIFISVVVKGHR